MTDPCVDAVGRREFERTIERVSDRITHQKEMLDLQTKLTERALQLQAEEYERRLDHLNNEHKRAEEARSRTVSMDTYVSDQRNYTVFRDDMKTFKDNLNGKIAVAVAIGGAIWAIIVAGAVMLIQGWR